MPHSHYGAHKNLRSSLHWLATWFQRYQFSTSIDYWPSEQKPITSGDVATSRVLQLKHFLVLFTKKGKGFFTAEKTPNSKLFFLSGAWQPLGGNLRSVLNYRKSGWESQRARPLHTSSPWQLYQGEASQTEAGQVLPALRTLSILKPCLFSCLYPEWDTAETNPNPKKTTTPFTQITLKTGKENRSVNWELYLWQRFKFCGPVAKNMSQCRRRHMTVSNKSSSVFSATEMKGEVLLPWALVNPLCFAPTHPKVIEPKLPQVVARENCTTKFAELWQWFCIYLFTFGILRLEEFQIFHRK